MGRIVVLDVWRFQSQSGHDGTMKLTMDDGAVDRANDHDVKRTTLKWEPVGVLDMCGTR